MNTRHRTAITLAAALTAAVPSCAPVDTPAPQSKSASRPVMPPVPAVALPAAAARDPLEVRIDSAITQARHRDLQTTNGFWTVFHGILGLGPTIKLLNPATGERVNALDYVASGAEVRGLRFVPTRDGLDVETRPGTFISQGHQDQFVAEMVQWAVPPSKKFVVEGRDYTFKDFIAHTKMRASVKANQELEWALLIIGQHFGTDYRWTNSTGETLRFEDLLRKELDRPIETAACGGTHRLFGLSWVYHLHLQKGGKTEGIWKDVSDRLDRYKGLARSQQNKDGSFSTDFFRGPAQAPDMQLRLNTTGHIFEWLALALSDEELHEPWVRKAADALTLMFLEIQQSPMEGGTLYHAAHGLLIYSSRVFGSEKLGELTPPVPLTPRAGKSQGGVQPVIGPAAVRR